MKKMEDDTCPYCLGTGKDNPDCETCDGKGWVEDYELGGTMTCPDCLDLPCEYCDGTGEKMSD